MNATTETLEIRHLYQELAVMRQAALIWFLRSMQLVQERNELVEAIRPFAAECVLMDAVPQGQQEPDESPCAPYFKFGRPSMGELRELGRVAKLIPRRNIAEMDGSSVQQVCGENVAEGQYRAASVECSNHTEDCR